jgi:hypothetical protein
MAGHCKRHAVTVAASQGETDRYQQVALRETTGDALKLRIHAERRDSRNARRVVSPPTHARRGPFFTQLRLARSRSRCLSRHALSARKARTAARQAARQAYHRPQRFGRAIDVHAPRV